MIPDRPGLAVARLLPPETAHRLALAGLRLGAFGSAGTAVDPRLRVRLWGHEFPNPVGIAAGFDKNAVALDGLFRIGAGFVEAGGVTPRPQPGNPRPRVFRLREDRALVNRLGFNNAGLDAFARRLRAFRENGRFSERFVAVNLGANKDVDDPVADYVTGARALAPLADALTINVSSPNTPGLRDLQARDRLEALVRSVDAALAGVPGGRPVLLVKLAPDLDDATRADLAGLVPSLRREDGARVIDGLVISNTTVTRPDGLRSRHAGEGGGLSGRPLFAPSTRMLAEFRAALGADVPLIGVGGVDSGERAYAKIRAGASLVQLYTGIVHGGPGVVARIVRDLAGLLKRDGFASVVEAVGCHAASVSGAGVR